MEKVLEIAPEIYNKIPNLVIISGFLEKGEPDMRAHLVPHILPDTSDPAL